LPAPPDNLYALETDHLLAASERELLGFILTNGDSPLEFESDSPYFDASGQRTVAEFIDEALASDGPVFANDIYTNTYERYFSLYDEGLPQEKILRTMLDGEDRTVAFVAAQLSEQKYLLTVKSFQDSLAARSSWLAAFVPKAIMVYQGKKLDEEFTALTRELAGAAPEREREIMERIRTISLIRHSIKVHLGRDVSTDGSL
jgi:hypothetical protein